MFNKSFLALTLAVAVWACAPDDPEHPCDPESGIYTGCAKVGVGEECTIDPECEGDNVVCQAGVCVCIPDCTGRECGADGCGGSCGECATGWQCGGEQVCEWTEEGTWAQIDSGLVWQIVPMGGAMNWEDAKTHCGELSLGGHSSWRLPDIGELRSLIRGCPEAEVGSNTCNVQEGGCLTTLCNEFCTCSDWDGPADGCYWPDEMQGDCSSYWSSSALAGHADFAWAVDFDLGKVYYNDIDDYFGNDELVRCVRDVP